jgi:hypothetical protein
VDSGNDEDVPAGCREDIEEGHGPWGFMNNLGREATGEDLAEDAVGHGGSVAQVRRPRSASRWGPVTWSGVVRLT